MNAITSMLTTLEKGIAETVKNAMQRVPKELSAFTGEFLQGPDKKDGLVKAKSGNLYYGVPNKTKKLRTLYGNIQRAITPSETGNVSHVELIDGVITVTFGVDFTANVTAGNKEITLKYAEGHEKTRPYISRGFERYYKNPQGYAALIKELEDAVSELAANA